MNKLFNQHRKKIISTVLTIFIIPLCFEIIFGIKNTRMRIDVVAEEIVFDPSPYILFNIDTLKENHDPIERILFSNSDNNRFTQVSAITLMVSNRGRKSIDASNYDNIVPITITFENSEFASKPYLWSETCAIPLNELKIQYPNTIILPPTILNHNDCYYVKVLLITKTFQNTPKITVYGRISNQKKINLKIDKNVHFFNDEKENFLLRPEIQYLHDQNWEECTTI